MTRCSPGRRMKIFRRGWPERICRNSSETAQQIGSCMATPIARGVTNAIGMSSPEIIFRSDRRPDNLPPERSRGNFRVLEPSEDAEVHYADEPHPYDLAIAAAVERGKRENEDIEAMSAEMQPEQRRNFYQNGLPLPTSRSGSTQTTHSMRDKPCFNTVMTNMCSKGGNCPFSHDEALINKEGALRYRDLMSKQQQRGPRSAAIIDTQDEEDDVVPERRDQRED